VSGEAGFVEAQSR